MQDQAQQQDVGAAIEAESLDVCVPFPFYFIRTRISQTYLTLAIVRIFRWRFRICGVSVSVQIPSQQPRTESLTLRQYRAGSLTETLSSQILRGVKEYGRTYAAYGNEGQWVVARPRDNS